MRWVTRKSVHLDRVASPQTLAFLHGIGLDDLAASSQDGYVRIAAALGVVGLLAGELFETSRGLLVNELAMRPHNSGHWSIDGAATSQF